MSDFLNNLIANAQSPGEAIQPRLGPLYGSSPMIFFPATGEPTLDLETEVDGPVLHEPLFRAPIESAFADDHALADAPASMRSKTLSSAADQLRHSEAWALAEMDLHATPATTLQDTANVQPSLVDPALQTRAASNQQNKPPALSPLNGDIKAAPFSTPSLTGMPGQGARSKRVPNTFLKGEKPISATLTSRSVIAGDKTQSAPLDLHSIENGEYLTLPETGIVPSPWHFLTGASRLASPGQRELEPVLLPPSAQAESPAPTIRVNIGRIEVRAITSPAVSVSPSTRKRSNPHMSLDDYLKQRNGGGR